MQIMKPLYIVITVSAYFITLFIISWLTSRKADSNTFFIGNRRSPWYLVAVGMIGASISGVTFISVPGWVITSKFFYMQMVLGYLLGYIVVIHLLLPLYYRLNLTSIYTYLSERFGIASYKTGAVFFIISRIIGSSFRLFLMANVLQITIFNYLHVPFILTTGITLAFIYIYTFRGGVRTIIWTDTLQAVLMVLSVIVTIIFISRSMHYDFSAMIHAVAKDEHSQIFNFTKWKKSTFFLKEFLSGAFITIVMTGLDQDMMQKNLSCRSLRDAQKNMYWYSFMLVPINLLFLSLGVLLVIFAHHINFPLPQRSDDLYPLLATHGYLPPFLGIIFMLGLIAAAYSSADSALTALTTSVTIDIMNAANLPEERLRRLRWKVHFIMSVVMGTVIVFFRLLNKEAVISALFEAAGYTYGPLLGLYAFGILTKRKLIDKWVPVIAVLSPLLTFLFKIGLEKLIKDYHAGYEILLLNGLITLAGLFMISKKGKVA